MNPISSDMEVLYHDNSYGIGSGDGTNFEFDTDAGENDGQKDKCELCYVQTELQVAAEPFVVEEGGNCHV